MNRLDGSTMTAVVRPTKPLADLRGADLEDDSGGLYLPRLPPHPSRDRPPALCPWPAADRQGPNDAPQTVTAFTPSHSITLGIATLGYASVPLPPLNAAIALSILFLGPEIVRTWRGETDRTIRYPWVWRFCLVCCTALASRAAYPQRAA